MTADSQSQSRQVLSWTLEDSKAATASASRRGEEQVWRERVQRHWSKVSSPSQQAVQDP